MLITFIYKSVCECNQKIKKYILKANNFPWKIFQENFDLAYFHDTKNMIFLQSISQYKGC